MKLNSRSTKVGITAPGNSWSARNRRSAERPASSRAPGFLVFARQEALVGPGGLERRDEFRLSHDLSTCVATVEFLDHRMQCRPVDERVVGRHRDAQDVAVAVLGRAGQVCIDRSEAEHEGLGDRSASHLGGWFDRLERGELFER